MQPEILTCAHITKNYTVRNQKRIVLSDISLSLTAGQILTITGRSGAGKSTLLSILAGLEPPDGGVVKLFDMDITAAGEASIARLRHTKTGFLFQNHNLISSWTAFENVEAALAHRKLSAAQMNDKVLGVLQELSISDLADHLPAQMSAGEQQRVALARAIVHQPALIFADEPIADVDPETGDSILKILIKATRERETAIVFVTHGQPPAGFDSQVMVLQEGVVSHL